MLMRNHDLSAGLRTVLEVPIFSPIRRHIMWLEALAEHRFVLGLSNRYGVPAFGYQHLEEKLKGKGNRICYVLGSGSSVEHLGIMDFETISREVSIGINAWVLHDFIPDIYSFEPTPTRDSSHYSTMRLLNRGAILERQPSILFLKPRTPIELEQLRMVPQLLASQVLLYGRFQPYTRKKKNLRSDLFALTAPRFRNLAVLPDSGASIIRMAFLAILLGFRKVVFVGVDLNHTEYFWEINPKYLDDVGLKSFGSGQTGQHHETLSSINRAFGLIEFMEALRDFGEAIGVSLEIANPASTLADILPIHHFRNS